MTKKTEFRVQFQIRFFSSLIHYAVQTALNCALYKCSHRSSCIYTCESLARCLMQHAYSVAIRIVWSTQIVNSYHHFQACVYSCPMWTTQDTFHESHSFSPTTHVSCASLHTVSYRDPFFFFFFQIYLFRKSLCFIVYTNYRTKHTHSANSKKCTHSWSSLQWIICFNSMLFSVSIFCFF